MQLLKLVICLTLTLILLFFFYFQASFTTWPAYVCFDGPAHLLFIVCVVSICVFCTENDFFLFNLCLHVCSCEAI